MFLRYVVHPAITTLDLETMVCDKRIYPVKVSSEFKKSLLLGFKGTPLIWSRSLTGCHTPLPQPMLRLLEITVLYYELDDSMKIIPFIIQQNTHKRKWDKTASHHDHHHYHVKCLRSSWYHSCNVIKKTRRTTETSAPRPTTSKQE